MASSSLTLTEIPDQHIIPEPSYSRQLHDVDQDDIAGLAGECLKRFLASVCFLNLPTLVLKGEANGGADSFVVLDGEDAGFHIPPLSPMGAATSGFLILELWAMVMRCLHRQRRAAIAGH